MDQNSTKLGLQAFKIVCATLFLFAICTNCGFVIKPSVFKGTNSGELQISYTLIYAGSTSSSQTLYYPVNVALQCPAGGRVDPIIIEQQCNLIGGQAYVLSYPGEITVNDNDSFSSLHWNIIQHQGSGSSDGHYTASIGSSEWKLSPNQCSPYEIRISAQIEGEVQRKKCYTLSATLTAGVTVGNAQKEKTKIAAEASLEAEFGATWEDCSEWVEPAKSYVLYSNVVMNSPYPSKAFTASVCGPTRIDKDAYGNQIFPYNERIPNLPSWITWDDESYIAKPSASNVGNHTFTLGVFGPCGVKNFTVYIAVTPQPQYSNQSFTVDACAASKLEIKNTDGAIAFPSSPGASLTWITYNNQTYTAGPNLTHIGRHNATFTVVDPCGTKTVNASILVQPERPYNNISYNVKACSTVRLKAKDAYGNSVTPSTQPSNPGAWITYDGEDYIAKPLSQNIGTHAFNLSMFSYCGPRNITASIAVSQAEDFIVDKKIISVSSTDNVSYHNLSIIPSTKTVVCQNFTSSSGNYDWVSFSKTGFISLTPTNVQNGNYSFKGMCVDNCGHSRESRVDIQITTSNADYLLPVGLLAVLVYAMLF